MVKPGTLCREARLTTSKSEVDPLSNVGAEVASRLREVGITTPDDLRRLGSVEAAVRLVATRPDDPPCRSMLSRLEGAIRGVRWHAIPTDERDRLWEVFQAAIKNSG